MSGESPPTHFIRNFIIDRASHIVPITQSTSTQPNRPISFVSINFNSPAPTGDCPWLHSIVYTGRRPVSHHF